jgi:hypothetical protein
MKLWSLICTALFLATPLLSLTVFEVRNTRRLAALQTAVNSLVVSDASNMREPQREYSHQSIASALLSESSVAPPRTAGDVGPRLSARKRTTGQGETAESRREGYEAAFAADASDSRWTEASKKIMAQRLQEAMPPGSILRSFDCHSSSCRIETGHPDQDHFQRYLAAAFIEPSTRIPIGSGGYSIRLDTETHEGNLVYVSFMPREGKVLPALGNRPGTPPSPQSVP